MLDFKMRHGFFHLVNQIAVGLACGQGIEILLDVFQQALQAFAGGLIADFQLLDFLAQIAQCFV
jgi:hypothetical protein